MKKCERVNCHTKCDEDDLILIQSSYFCPACVKEIIRESGGQVEVKKDTPFNRAGDVMLFDEFTEKYPKAITSAGHFNNLYESWFLFRPHYFKIDDWVWSEKNKMALKIIGNDLDFELDCYVNIEYTEDNPEFKRLATQNEIQQQRDRQLRLITDDWKRYIFFTDSNNPINK